MARAGFPPLGSAAEPGRAGEQPVRRAADEDGQALTRLLSDLGSPNSNGHPAMPSPPFHHPQPPSTDPKPVSASLSASLSASASTARPIRLANLPPPLSPNSLPNSLTLPGPTSPSPSAIPSPGPGQTLPQLLLPAKHSAQGQHAPDHPILPFPRLAQPLGLQSPLSAQPGQPNAHILINFFPPTSPIPLDRSPKLPARPSIHNASPPLPTRYRTHSGVLEIRMPTLQPPRPPSQTAAPARLPLNPLPSASRTNLAGHPPGSPPRPRPLSAPDRQLVFCCDGRLVNAPPRQTLPRRRGRALRVPFQTLGSLSLLVGLGALFVALVAAFLVSQPGGGALLGVFVYCWLLCLSAMAKTVASDPGVLPRRLDPAPDTEWQPASNADADADAHDDAAADGGEKAKLEVGEWTLVPRWIKVEPSAASQLGATRIVDEQPSQPVGQMADERATEWVQSKWCNTCLSYRPPRSSHCRICDCCIDGIDHHCSYLNNCIGSRNYRSFFVFLLTSTTNLVLIISGALWKLIEDSGRRRGGFGEAVRENVGCLVLVIVAVLLMVPIAALTVYHIFLTTKGLTTVEYIKAKTMRKVLKENSGLVEDFYGRGEGVGKVGRGGPGERRSTVDLVMWRLCRPATDSFVGRDWRRAGVVVDEEGPGGR